MKILEYQSWQKLQWTVLVYSCPPKD